MMVFVTTVSKDIHVDISVLFRACLSAAIPRGISTHCLQVLNLGFDPRAEECSESHASAESLRCRSGYLVSCNCEAAG